MHYQCIINRNFKKEKYITYFVGAVMVPPGFPILGFASFELRTHVSISGK